MRAVMSGYALRANPTLYYLAMMNLVVFLVHRGLHRKERVARLTMQTAMHRCIVLGGHPEVSAWMPYPTSAFKSVS